MQEYGKCCKNMSSNISVSKQDMKNCTCLFMDTLISQPSCKSDVNLDNKVNVKKTLSALKFAPMMHLRKFDENPLTGSREIVHTRNCM